MKLIREFSIKVIILIFSLLVALEFCNLLYIYLTSKSIFQKTYDESIKRTEEKSLEITRNLKTFTTNYFLKFITELKLIAKYTLLFKGKSSNNFENIINKNSKFVKNNNLNKKIIEANTKSLYKIPDFKKIYNATGDLNELGKPIDNSTLKYIQYYSQIFGEEKDRNKIITKLFKEHDELNYISYYYYGNITDYNISDFPEKEEFIKNILVIIKSIFIQRMITKKTKMDIIRFLIITNEEIFIYPPEDCRKINLIHFGTANNYCKCNYNNTNLNAYLNCTYDCIINYLFENRTNDIYIVKEKIKYQEVLASICFKFPFNRIFTDELLLCIEIDFASIITSFNLNDAKIIEFGLINPIQIILYQSENFLLEYKEIIVLFDNKKDIYYQLFDVFNSSDTTPLAYLLNSSDTTKLSAFFSLYHFIHFNTTKILKENPNISVNISQLSEEYTYVRDKIFEIRKEFLGGNKKEIYSFKFNKTIIKKVVLGNEYECVKDEFEMLIIPVSININKVNEDFIETNEINSENYGLFIYTIISTNPEINRNVIKTILLIKLIRLICYYFFVTFIIFSFFILFINIISEYSFDSINQIINDINNIEIDDEKREIKEVKENKNFMANKEMLNLKNIYEIMRKSLIIKNVFNKEFFLSEHHLEFYGLIQDIERKNIKEICNSFIAYYHYQNNKFSISESEIKSTVNFIKENENKLKKGEKNEYDDKLKDAIRRSSTVSYLNEYSKFENIDENIMDIIYLKIFKQRFIYLYAMNKFKLGNEINSAHNNSQNNAGEINKNKIKKMKEKKINYFKDAIKYFQECHNINALLGINQIKIIYSLIMISKCYIELNDYKSAIININDALTLYFEFSQAFKDYHAKNYNPKIMLFVESNIFHYILFTISRICKAFNKPSASNWIILKIFETSPFFFDNVHYHAGVNLFMFLDRNKTKMIKYYKNFYKNSKLMKEYERMKKYFLKINSRLYIKNKNSKNIISTSKLIADSIISYKTPTLSESITDRSKLSSNLKKENETSRVSSALMNKNRKLNKILTLCLSERILERLNGQEFKDVLIKYFQKYFVSTENDKFSFIQFANNGKKTVSIKSETLNDFLLKFQKTKEAFELTDSFKADKDFIFMELYNIFDSIIKSESQIEEMDNIIMIFMNSEDIRFSSAIDCLNIVEDLNKKNASVYFFSFETEIKEEKINNIQSFLNGLIEGYFFQIKNYQQLKQIFINISTVKNQTNFFGFDHQIFDHIL